MRINPAAVMPDRLELPAVVVPEVAVHHAVDIADAVKAAKVVVPPEAEEVAQPEEDTEETTGATTTEDEGMYCFEK